MTSHRILKSRSLAQCLYLAINHESRKAEREFWLRFNSDSINNARDRLHKREQERFANILKKNRFYL